MKSDAISCLAAAIVLGFGCTAQAQSDAWDSLLTDSQWSVPADNLRAYITPGTNLATPQTIADQTLWTIGTCTNGVFSGTSDTTVGIGGLTSTNTMTMSGVITDSGQVRIAFSQPDYPTTIGLGQVTTFDGQTSLEMQMLTEIGSGYVTHWAYMVPWSGDPSTLPPLQITSTDLAPNWAWMNGSSWKLQSDALFGSGESGLFTLTGYNNGYFWGSGTGDTGTFTLIGSATPEGEVLFNVLDSTGTMTSLTGSITGDASDGAMALRGYTIDGLGDFSTAQVVPEPSVGLLLGFSIVAGCGWQRWTARRARIS